MAFQKSLTITPGPLTAEETSESGSSSQSSSPSTSISMPSSSSISSTGEGNKSKSKSKDKSSTTTRNISNPSTDLTDNEKYVLATTEASSLLDDRESNKKEIAKRVDKSEDEVGKMHEEDLQKALIDSFFEGDLHASKTGREIRGENWFTDTVSGAKNAINDFNTWIGGGIDAASDAVIGGLVDWTGGEEMGQQFRDALTGEDFAVIPDIAEDVALSLIPGAGIPLVVGKNAIQNSEELYKGVTGLDPVTQASTDIDQGLNLGTGIFNTALAALPGVGKVANAAKAASKAGKAAEEATKATNKALEGGAEKLTTLQEAIPGSDEAKILYQGLKSGVANPSYTTAIPEEQIPKNLIFAANSGDEAAQVELAGLRNGISTGGVGLSEEAIPESLKTAAKDTPAITEQTALTTDEALDSIIADVDRSASTEAQISQIKDSLKALSVEDLSSKELNDPAEAIQKAMTSADTANSVSAINALRASGRFAERGLGGSLAHNAAQSLTPRRVRALQNRTLTRTGHARGDNSEQQILRDLGVEGVGTGEELTDMEREALRRAGSNQFRSALFNGTDAAGQPALTDAEAAAWRMGSQNLKDLEEQAARYGGGSNGFRMLWNRHKGKPSKAWEDVEKEQKRLNEILGKKGSELTEEETAEATQLMGNLSALSQKSEAAARGISEGIPQRFGRWAGRTGANYLNTIFSGAAASNQDPLSYLEGMGTNALNGDFSQVISPIMATFIPTGKKHGYSLKGTPNAIRPTSTNAAYTTAALGGQANLEETEKRNRPIPTYNGTSNELLDYLRTSAASPSPEA